MCLALNVHRSGFYAWLKHPESKQKQDNKHLLVRIKEAYTESGGVYGSLRITHELRQIGATCGENRVSRLMKHNK